MSCHFSPRRHAVSILATIMLAVAGLGVSCSAAAARDWFKTKTSAGMTLPHRYLAERDAYALDRTVQVERAGTVVCGTAVCVDLLVTLDGNPQGDARKPWVQTMEHFADAIWEATEKKHKLRNIRIYRNNVGSNSADIYFRVPTSSPVAGAWPHVRHMGGVMSGGRIEMFASVRNGPLVTQYLDRPEVAGYVLAHEMGHYFYGVYDEYPVRADDVPVEPSIMNEEDQAADSWFFGSDKRWLNFSVAAANCGLFNPVCKDYRNFGNNEQMRKLHASAWQVLARSPADDPGYELQIASGRRLSLGPRMYHPELAAVAPKAFAQPNVDLPNDNSRSSLYYLTVDGDPAVTVPATDPRSELRVIWMDEAVENEVVVVIDRSGSMTSDRLTPAKQAAKALVDQFNTRSRMAVLSFSTTVTTVHPLTTLNSDATRDGIKSAIETIAASGDTAIGDAALAALDLLQSQGSEKRSRMVLLLTDGENNAGVEPSTVLPAYQNAQIPLITFGYGGSAALLDLLQTMSDQTGGKSFAAPTTGQAVIDTFQTAAAMATEMPTLLDRSAQAPAGQTFQQPVVIDASVSELVQTVSHAGTASASTVRLRAPDGSLIMPYSIYESGGETTRLFRIAAPAAGDWMLQLTPTSGALAFRTVARASTQGGTYEVGLTTDTGTPVGVIGRPVKVLLRVARDYGVTGLGVDAILRQPDGSEVPLTFSDTGAAPDEVAADGVYTLEFRPANTGVYHLLARANNRAGTARYTTLGTFMPAAPGGGAMEGDFIGNAFTDRFERSATLDIDVSADFGTATGAGSTAFSSSGDLPWRVANDGYAGGTSAQSGAVSDSQSSTLQTTVLGPGNGSFYWKVGSERSYDNLKFYIDGVEQGRISGTVAWTRVSFSVAEGAHVLKWIYAKDAYVTSAPDAGWVDQFLYGRSMPLADVSTDSSAYAHISRLYHAGITSGCGGGNYCPTQAVNREQMAAFMVRAKEGEPAGNCATSPYSDVPTGSTFCKYIQRMAALGITSGCGGGKYCPTQAVDRQQMAALIVRAVEGEPVTGCTTPPFTDVATGDTFCKYIQRMVALGITSGCGGGKYCPTQAVNRETMAVFLGRAFLGM